MNDDEKKRERRKQRRLEQIGTNNPVCLACGGTTWYLFEGHHVAGRRYDKHVEYFSKECHGHFTEMQESHPPPTCKNPGTVECAGHYALGLADIFYPISRMLQQFGYKLVELSDGSEVGSESTKQLLREIGRFLIALAGFLVRVGERLREYGTRLTDEAHQKVFGTKEPT